MRFQENESVDNEGDGIYRDDYEIKITEDGLRLTAICPICSARVVGYMSHQLDLDLVDHMNFLHKPRADRGHA